MGAENINNIEETKKEQQIKKQFTINGITIYRILTYFAIYSILGYILETIFAIIAYGKFESRQGFLYGPVCPIYGVGAVIMIIALQKFQKNGYTLFLGGMIVGSIVEYIISLFGELVLNVRWWDYTGRFLNIHGRICLLYSIYWGIIAIYLMKSLNPHIDKFINFFRARINIKTGKKIIILVTIFLFIDCIVSAFAIELFLSRTVVEKNIPAQNRQWYVNMYEKYYSNENIKNFIENVWGNSKVLRTYPNLRLTIQDGTVIHVKDQYPEIQPYYYKFRDN